MQKVKKQKKEFIQDPSYAVHFETYKGILSKLLHHDPNMFSLEKKLKIVDVGCGYGDLLKLLRHRGYKNLVGIEPDPMCRNGCIKEKLDVRDGTITKTGLPNNFADVVIVNEVFHHINNYEEAVKELSRIIKPGGYLCFLEPAPTFLRKLMDIITFGTPLPQWIKPLSVRYSVMKLEMDTGLYPYFLNHQKEFRNALNNNFNPVWHRTSWFFQFGKYHSKKS